MSEEKKAADKGTEKKGAEKAPELDGIDPYAANGTPDEGLHGNADY